MATSNETLGAKALRVKEINTSELYANPHNPRMLFDRVPLKILEESIEKVGILVPLTVYRENSSKKYIILDGQRRWMCAQNLKINKIPINEVAQPSLVQNIVTMFQIHKLREDWELMPTALKVEVLINKMKERDSIKLSKITGLDESVITRCKRLLSFDRSYQDMMLDADPNKRLKADFFIELYSVIHDREVVKFSWFKQKRFTDQMLDKYLNEPRTIKSVTDFRLIKQYLSLAKKADVVSKFSNRLKEFSEARELPLHHLEIKEVNKHAGVTKIKKQVSNFYTTFRDLDTQLYYGEEELWNSVNELIILLKEKLKQVNKRIS